MFCLHPIFLFSAGWNKSYWKLKDACFSFFFSPSDVYFQTPPQSCREWRPCGWQWMVNPLVRGVWVCVCRVQVNNSCQSVRFSHRPGPLWSPPNPKNKWLSGTSTIRLLKNLFTATMTVSTRCCLWYCASNDRVNLLPRLTQTWALLL